MLRLYANSALFYVRDLSLCGVRRPRQVLEPVPGGHLGTTVLWESGEDFDLPVLSTLLAA